jgi:aryl-alcohol dehydrogenase-like predicted oxidoreductase
MNYRSLGRTGLVVSEIGFGAWGIGGRTVSQTSYGDTDDRTSLAALARAQECGITFFDTSAVYGNGHSEELIGKALSGVRHKVVLATKAGYEAWDRPPDFSAAAIVASIERSLGRLRTDYLDLLLLHNPPLDVLLALDVQEALARLVASGKVRAWGASCKGPDDALEALRACDVSVIQANFNMMDVRAVTSGLFEEVSRQNAGFIARTPLCFGFLSGTVTRDTKFPPGDHRLGWSSAQLANWIDGARDLLEAVSASPGLASVQAALRFCLAFPEVSCTIPGILTPAEAGQNAAASGLGALPKDAVAAVLEINRNRQFFVAAAKAS